MRAVPLLLVATGALALAGAQASAQVPGPVVIIEVRGLIDRSLARFTMEALEDQANAGAQLAILELNSAGAADPEVYDLLDMLAAPPLPTAVWVGPAPAVAYGAAGQMLGVAPIRAAAPGARVGYLSPGVAGHTDPAQVVGPPDLIEDVVVVDAPIHEFIDHVEPALPQFVASLHGLEVSTPDGTVVLSTLVESTRSDGSVVVHPVEARFVEPGLGIRILRTGLNPDAAFFLLVVGLSVAALEFYALGPGLAAGAAALALLLASYGLAAMPLRWWALPVALLGVLAHTVQFQRTARAGAGTWAGSALLVAAGVGLTSGSPQFAPTAWITLLSVATVTFLFVIAMPAVARARLSAPTVGRSWLVGHKGTASSDFTQGEGSAEIDGARWRAASHREAGLRKGDVLVVTAVEGTYLLVDPVRENNPEK